MGSRWVLVQWNKSGSDKMGLIRYWKNPGSRDMGLIWVLE